MLLGAHESIAGGIHRSVDLAREDGCLSIQIFVKSPNRWDGPPLKKEEIEGVKKAMKKEFPPSVWTVHAGYLINLGNPDEEKWKKSYTSFREEVLRTRTLSIPSIIVHPGSHLGAGRENGIKQVSRAINLLHKEIGTDPPMILLETMPGAKDQLFSRWEEFEEVFSLLDHPDAVGVCADTCHLFVGGIPLYPRDAYEKTMEEVEKRIGVKKISVWHLNDAKGDFGSRKDRHEHIGEGKIPPQVFFFLLNDPRFKDIPGILETPERSEKDRGYKENLLRLKTLKKKGSL